MDNKIRTNKNYELKLVEEKLNIVKLVLQGDEVVSSGFIRRSNLYMPIQVLNDSLQ